MILSQIVAESPVNMLRLFPNSIYVCLRRMASENVALDGNISVTQGIVRVMCHGPVGTWVRVNNKQIK